MKRILFILSLALLVGAPSMDAQTKTNKPQRQGWNGPTLYGKVKKVTYRVDKENQWSENIYTFNNNGDVVEDVMWMDDGYIGRTVYKYDSKGQLVQESMYDYDDVLWWKKVFKYDANGNVVEWVQGINEVNEKEVYRYASNGNKIETQKYGYEGRYMGSEAYRYDASGKMIESLNYNENGVFTGRTEYKYDTEGNLIEVLGYDWNDAPSGFHTNKYDSKGNETESALYDAQGKQYGFATYKYTYDSLGNVVEMSEYSGDRTIAEWTSIFKIEYK